MKFPKVIFVAIGSIVGLAGSVLADTAICDEPISEQARIGWPGALTLSITEDVDDRECRFSIEGVPAGSPPADELAEAAQRLRSANFSIGGGFDPIELASTVPLLLAAASPSDQADPDLQTDEFISSIAQCFDLVRSQFFGEFVSSEEVGIDLDRFDVRCALATPDSIEQLNEFLGGSVFFTDISQPKLAIRNERSDSSLVEYLFIPFSR
ncbi:hypothetical protein [Roseisalinus antarcticus]|uniref:Uncharacterized protein n=1 Tax=Roseisalinus antarcticus TaxID=254357 RepID=A0A1Y5U5D6_9RHOB|nr:hypothetical protein [Roseisalinus antarcticus]SLN77328.1 hypothetical protein ROA7023_04360 [Roseisalinus antarcticus]